MILKRTWFSYFIWGVFVAFLAAIVTMFWYLSELLPEEMRIGLSAGLAGLTILAVCLVAFAAGRLVTYLRPKLHPDPKTLDIIDFILAGLLLFASFIVRIVWLSGHASEINDASGLFDEAMIVADGSNSLTDLLSILTAGIVSVFLRIAGNRIMVGAVVMAVMQVIMIICLYFAVRLLTGRVAALISTAIIGFVPAYFTRLTVVQNQVTFFMLFAMEFLVVAIYLRLDAKGVYNSVWYVLWFIAVGVCMGYMAYVDFATVILWIPMLLTLMLPRTEKKDEAVRLLIIFGASFIMFLIMLIQEDGISYLTDTIPYFFTTYFDNTNTVLIFHLPVEVYPVYLVIVTAMSFLMVTFWRDQTRDFTTLWLLLFLAAALIVPLFGPTRMNAQDLLCFCYATVIGSGVTCLIAPPRKKARQAEIADQPAVAVMVPAGMVLPMDTETDNGLPHMQMPVPDEQMPLGIDRGQEALQTMNENMMMDQNIPAQQPGMMPGAVPGQIPVAVPGQVPIAAPGQVPVAAPGQMPVAMEQPLSKAELKAQAKAQKAQAKAEAKAARKAEKEARKAARLRFLDDDDEDEDLMPAAQPQLQAAPVAAPGIPGMMPQATPAMPGAVPAASAPTAPAAPGMAAPSFGGQPVTTRPNLTRNPSAAAGGTDDFDFDIGGGDDFDI